MSLIVLSFFLSRKQFSTHNDSGLDPNYVTGFADGESSFIVSVFKRDSKLGWQVAPKFSIEVHNRDLELLEKIQLFFKGVGTINERKTRNGVIYTISYLSELVDVLIPHFEAYALVTNKQADFILFRDIVNILNTNKENTLDRLYQILKLKSALNKGLSKELIAAFPDIELMKRPVVQTTEKFNPYWISGFTDAEGCFNANIYKSNTKIGSAVTLRFRLTQNIRDKQLLDNLKIYLNCGFCSFNDNTGVYVVLKIQDLFDIIIPHFQKYPIIGIKYFDYLDFCKIAEIIKLKEHLTQEGLDKIKLIVKNMNTGRK